MCAARPKINRSSRRKTTDVSKLVASVVKSDEKERELFLNITHAKVEKRLSELPEREMLDMLLNRLQKFDESKERLSGGKKPAPPKRRNFGLISEEKAPKARSKPPPPRKRVPPPKKRPMPPKSKPKKSSGPPPIPPPKRSPKVPYTKRPLPKGPPPKPKRSLPKPGDDALSSTTKLPPRRKEKKLKRTVWKTHGRRDKVKTFGVALKPDDDVPLFIVDALAFLKEHPRQGIFRICGSKTKLLKTRDMLNEGRSVNLKKLDVANVSGLVKMWCREYPVRIFDPIFPNLEKVIKGYAKGEGKEMIRKFLRQLSPPHREFLNMLSFCAHSLAKKSDETKMNSKNLAICIGPTIFRFKKEQFKIIPMANGVLQALMDDYDQFFPKRFADFRKRKPEVKNYRPPKNSKIKLTEEEAEDELRSQIGSQATEYINTVQSTLSAKEFKRFQAELRRMRKKPKEFDILAQDLFNIFGHKNKELVYGFQNFLPNSKIDGFRVAVDTLIRGIEVSAQKYEKVVQKALPESEFKEFKLFAGEQMESPKDYYALAKDLMDIFYKRDPSLMYGFQVYIKERDRIKFNSIIDQTRKGEDRKKERARKKKMKEEEKARKKHEKKLKEEEKRKRMELQELRKRARNEKKTLLKMHNLIKDGKIGKIENLLNSSDEFDINGFHEGLTPLQWAVYYQQHDIVELLLEDPDVVINSISLKYPKKTGRGWDMTALMIAAYVGDLRTCKLLLSEEGVDIRVTTDKGKTCEDLCRHEKMKVILKQYREDKEIQEKSINERMQYVLSNYSDYVLTVGGDNKETETGKEEEEKISTLRVLLKRSPYLKKFVERKDVKIVEKDKYAVEKCLDFVYGKEPKILKSKLYNVFKLAKKWKLYNLMWIVVKKIQEKINFKDLLNILNGYLITEGGDFKGSVFELVCFKKLKIKFEERIGDSKTAKMTAKMHEKLKQKLAEIQTMEYFDRIVDHEDFMELTRREMSPLKLLGDDLYRMFDREEDDKENINFHLISNDYDVNPRSEEIGVKRELLIIRSQYFFDLFKKNVKLKEKKSVTIQDFNFKELKKFLKFTLGNNAPIKEHYLFKFLIHGDVYHRKDLLKSIKKLCKKRTVVRSILRYGYLSKRIDPVCYAKLRRMWEKIVDPVLIDQLVRQSESFQKRIDELRKEAKKGASRMNQPGNRNTFSVFLLDELDVTPK